MYNIKAEFTDKMLNFSGSSVGEDEGLIVWYTLSASFLPVWNPPWNDEYFTVYRFDARIYSDIERTELLEHIQQPLLPLGRYTERQVDGVIFV